MQLLTRIKPGRVNLRRYTRFNQDSDKFTLTFVSSYNSTQLQELFHDLRKVQISEVSMRIPYHTCFRFPTDSPPTTSRKLLKFCDITYFA